MRSRKYLRGITLGFVSIVFLFINIYFISLNPPTWMPTHVKNLFFDFRLVVTPQMLKVSSIIQGSVSDDRIYIDDFGQRVEFESEGLTIVGTLYSPEQEGKYPAIILSHGSTPEGRKLGLYRVLGRELSDREYVVLSIDLRGYGESDEPDSYHQSALDPTEDIIQAASYLVENVSNVDHENIILIGHSAGAKPSIAAGVGSEQISRIIAIGPPRRVQERYGSPDSPEFDYFLRRATKYMNLEEPISPQIFTQLNESLNIENYMNYFSQNGHKPILLIDGLLESEEDRTYLQALFEKMEEPKKYVSLEDADHYANIANFGSLVIYDRIIVNRLITEIQNWISNE